MALLEFNLYLSGGTDNADPNLSLGGDPSSIPVEAVSDNNLFADISGEDGLSGRVDYRCIYVVNDSGYDYSEVKILILSEVENGSSVALGIPTQNEVQSLKFLNNPQGGTFKLELDSYITSNINFTFNNTTLASNIQTALRAIVSGTDCVVTYSLSEDLFLVEFSGSQINHRFPLMTLNDNQLTYSFLPEPTISINLVQMGLPINSIAVDIGNDTIAPSNISFTTDAITVGNLKNSELFPVWVQRITPPESTPQAEDGFNLDISGDISLI